MGKLRSIYICQACGRQERKWKGKCPECGEFNTFVEEIIQERFIEKNLGKSNQHAQRFSKIETYQEDRLQTEIEEFDRVLGGGIVKGSLILIGGSPGIGKSTLLLQVAGKLSDLGACILYVAGEESEKQIKMRGERLKLFPENLFLLTETNLESIIEEAYKISPDYIIVDSIQTIFSAKLDSFPGSVSQVREAAVELMMYAKQNEVTIFLIGHVTKEGMIAGPKALEHIVDTVIYFEGDRHHNHRIIRAVKNRFGPTGEIGVFEMTESGLLEVKNPSEIFLQERLSESPGSVVTVCMEGTRPMLVEIQALVTETKLGMSRRMTQGFDYNRATLLLAILEKRLAYAIYREDVFINVAGGLQIDEPSADLAVIIAVVSSFRNAIVPSDTVIFGEVGLAGEIRSVSQAETRVREAQKLGFKRVILPNHNRKGLERLIGTRTIGVRTLEEAISAIF
ncbi:MAG: DNA repair protein RadA [Pyrinomonadaceae bacterium]|nr:DNA repair protein RadA [Pyrinomonadaceae bacterium]MCX7639868.1 DNA repair protein RadA [Pyrinomonadaceae bacterium]MDW8304040.1 DNA repair protein RadA [Acidobacteriota bacterium]